MPDWGMKRRAEEVIQNVSGVNDVLNNLRVKPQNARYGEDRTRTIAGSSSETCDSTISR